MNHLQASKYVMGSKVETRNNLSLYHPELLMARERLSFPSLYEQYPLTMKLPAPQLYPNDQRPVVIGLAVSNPKKNPTAGDLFTAKVGARPCAFCCNGCVYMSITLVVVST